MSDTVALNAADDDQKLLAQVVDYYHRHLKDSTEAKAYLTARGITTGQAIDAFRIGYADRTLGLTLPSKQVKSGEAIRARLQGLGLYRDSGHEHLNGCVVFPLYAPDGSRRIMDIYGRKILGERLRKGSQIHLNLNDRKEGVFNVGGFGAGGEVILCTSLWDALTFWNHGYRNVTTMFGLDALTADHLAAFAEYRVKRVITSSEAVTQKLIDAGIETFRFRLPQDTDVNAYAKTTDDPATALGALLRKAEWVGRGQPASGITVSVVPVEPPAESDDGDDVDEDELLEDELDDVDEDDAVGDRDKKPVVDPDAEDEPHVPTVPPAPPITLPPLRLASPVPAAPQDVDAEIGTDEVTLTFGNRRYRVRGYSRNLSFDQMRVNVLVTNEVGMFVDIFDLYSARHRKMYQQQAAGELKVEEDTVKKDLGRVLLKLEEIQDAQVKAALQPKDVKPDMTPDDKTAALALLRDPRLLDRIADDFQVVGERVNKLAAYLAAVSRKLDRPLAVIIQSTSAAGKTALMDAALAFVPPEDLVRYSAMTGQSLYYMGDSELRHKVLAIAEEEGAEKASYALKLLQSEGELRIASTGKEVASGRMVTQEYRVEGPVMLFLTTTSVKVDEELLNRCVVLTVDEDRDQTRAIHQRQRHSQTLAGMLTAHAFQKTLALHRNAQRLLKPLLVVNPYAEHLTFVDDKTRCRRDHMKYLTLIRAVALLHQHQRPTKTVAHGDEEIPYIEATLDDIAVANRLAAEVLGRSLDDIPPQTRNLLTLLDRMVTEGCRRQSQDRAEFRFTRREVREYTRWGNTQLKIHLARLVEMEFVIAHRGGRGQQFVYELLYDAPQEEGQKVLARLIDVDGLREAERSGSAATRSAPGRGAVAPQPAPGRTDNVIASPDEISRNGVHRPADDHAVYRDRDLACASYRTRRRNRPWPKTRTASSRCRPATGTTRRG